MAQHLVTFHLDDPSLGAHAPLRPVHVPTGTLLTEAARTAGVEIAQPCGGQGRCGRCAIHITQGEVRRRSTLRLSAEDVAAGYALACQSVVESDVSVTVPPQEKIERRLTTDRVVAEVEVPIGYDARSQQTVQRVSLSLTPPSMDDQTDDWSRLVTTLRQQLNVEQVDVSLPLLRRLGSVLRDAEWNVAAVFESALSSQHSAVSTQQSAIRLIDLRSTESPLFGLAIDIGTTTVSCWLVDLISGKVVAQVAEYNGQIARGEDVISRIIYASKNGSSAEMQALVIETINSLIATACERAKVDAQNIFKATVAGNSTMMHLLLDIPATSIRLAPFVTAINHVPPLRAIDLGLKINPEAAIDCLPGVASYVGADITAGVLSSGMEAGEQLTLFMDVGTNGEIVLGNRDWLVTCACSAGPAFEGAGVINGMRATRGAIEEVWINGDTFEPTYRVIGNAKPRGICGSGLIALLSEMFLTGVLDKGGNLNSNLMMVEEDSPHFATQEKPLGGSLSVSGRTRRVRQGEHGLEYVVAWASETWHGKDIVITHVDVDNLLRAKAAIYAGYTVLARHVDVPLDSVEQFLIGGSFGKYINVEKAVQIGLLPDLPWEKFQFLGNTSVKGAYLALLNRNERARIAQIASRMTYIELSADNTFYEAFTSALFLPHTDLSKFPSVEAALRTNEKQATETLGHGDS